MNRIRPFFAVLITFLVSGFPAVVAAAEQPRHYINVGADPVDPSRQVKWGSEYVAPLAEDAELSTQTGSGRWIGGWVHKGLRVVVPEGGDGTEGWILDCGNPFRSAKLLPLGPRQLTPQALATATASAATVPQEVNVKGIPSEINLNVNNGQPVQVQVAPVTLVTDPEHPLQVVIVKEKKKKRKKEKTEIGEAEGGRRCGKKCKIGFAIAGVGTMLAITLPIVLGGGGKSTPGGGPVDHTL